MTTIFRKNKNKPVSPAVGAAHIIGIAMVVFLCVSLSPASPNVNLQGKQGISKLKYDDALVYVLHEDGEHDYCIYDLNAYKALRKYCPEAEYSTDMPIYTCKGEELDISTSLLCFADDNTLNVRKNQGNSTVYLVFTDISADSFTIDDGITSETYEFTNEIYSITIHNDCTVTLNGGGADIRLIESIIDHPDVIPAQYADDNSKLHFNLWLEAEYQLS